MLRLFFARLGLVGGKALDACPARQSFSATVLAWHAMTREVECAGESARSFPVDNYS
jgi:hypothetical protein